MRLKGRGENGRRQTEGVVVVAVVTAVEVGAAAVRDDVVVVAKCWRNKRFEPK